MSILNHYKSFIVSFIILLTISLWAGNKLVTPLFFTSHDGEGHVIRMIEFHEALFDGHVPVRITKRIFFGTGYPFFNFNYPLVYYSAEFVHLLGFSFVDSFKLILFLSLFFGGIGIVIWLKNIFGMYPATIAAIGYILSPYRLLNTYVRGSLAECIALGILPWLFWSVYLLVKQGRFKPYTVLVSVLILTHNITALTAIGFTTLYGGLQLVQNKRRMILLKFWILSCIGALTITTFFWLPVIVESGQTKLIELTTDYQTMFLTLRDFVYTPWGFGSFVMGDQPGKMAPQVGVIHLSALLISLSIVCFHLLKTKNRFIFDELDRMLIIFICVAMVSSFLTFLYSKPIWDAIPLLQYVQLPWRLLGYVTLAASVSIGYIFSKTSGNKQIVLVFIFFFSLLYVTRNQIRVNQFIPFTNPFTNNQTYALSTTSKDEHMPIWAPRPKGEPPLDGVLYPQSAGMSSRTIWKTNHIQYIVKTNMLSEFMHYGYDYPGWEAWINGQKADYVRGTYGFGGLTVNLQPGENTVDFYFRETWYRKVANAVSIISILLFLGMVCLPHGWKIFIRVKHS